MSKSDTQSAAMYLRQLSANPSTSSGFKHTSYESFNRNRRMEMRWVEARKLSIPSIPAFEMILKLLQPYLWQPQQLPPVLSTNRTRFYGSRNWPFHKGNAQQHGGLGTVLASVRLARLVVPTFQQFQHVVRSTKEKVGCWVENQKFYEGDCYIES
jgi:hypothetical protein